MRPSTNRTHAQALDHSGRTLRQFGVRQAPTAGLLEAQHYSTAKAAYDAASTRSVTRGGDLQSIILQIG
jgi:hypothetical protein